MRKILAGLGVALCAVSGAAAQDAWPSPDETPNATAALLGRADLRAAAPVCRPERPIATPDSIGAISAGLTQRVILDRCAGRGLRVWDWGSEAIPEPGILQSYGGDLVLAVLEDTTLDATAYRLVSLDAETAEGITAGSTFSELRSAFPQIVLYEGECHLWVVGQGNEGLSFWLDLPNGAAVECWEIPIMAASNKADSVPAASRVRLVSQHAK